MQIKSSQIQHFSDLKTSGFLEEMVEKIQPVYPDFFAAVKDKPAYEILKEIYEVCKGWNIGRKHNLEMIMHIIAANNLDMHTNTLLYQYLKGTDDENNRTERMYLYFKSERHKLNNIIAYSTV